LLNVAVLASGRGSNFEAIVEHETLGIFNGVNIAVLIYNHAEANAVKIAEKYGVPAVFIEYRGKSRVAFEGELLDTLKSRNIDLACLSGWDQIAGAKLFEAYRRRMMNIHPALLPAFGWKGLDGRFVHRAILEFGAKITGVTVFYVDISVDGGPIIVQDPAEVKEEELALLSSNVPGDAERAVEMLSDRVLVHEHRLYSKAIQLHADGRVRLEGNKTIIDYSRGWMEGWKEREQAFIDHQKRYWAEKKYALDEVSKSC